MGRDDDNAYPGFSPFSDPAARLREHVLNGRLRVAGRTTVRGRTAPGCDETKKLLEKGGVRRP